MNKNALFTTAGFVMCCAASWFGVNTTDPLHAFTSGQIAMLGLLSAQRAFSEWLNR